MYFANKFYLRTCKRYFASVHQGFVPKHNPALNDDVKALGEFIEKSEKVLVLTGAGISTESGIPDYRSEGVGLYARSNHCPVQYRDYLKSAHIRQRYWARNFIGWPRFSQTLPNPTHHALHTLEACGKISCIVTQNVDSLHYKAGSKNVIELHGSASRVLCLDCQASYTRVHVQELLKILNRKFDEFTEMVRPDGDVEISQEKIRGFHPPFCQKCGGVLKPDIVFFGDNVPRTRVEEVKSYVRECDAVLVLGSSLSVFSGYRFVLQAKEEAKGVAIVNIGATRGDHLADLKVTARCGDILPKILD